MKFLSFVIYPVDKLAEVVATSDKIVANPPEGYKILNIYACQSNPFLGYVPEPGTLITFGIIECTSDEALASTGLQYEMAGATVLRIPIWEVSPGKADEAVEKIKA